MIHLDLLIHEYEHCLLTQKYLNGPNLHWATPIRHFYWAWINVYEKLLKVFMCFVFFKKENLMINSYIYTTMMIDAENSASNMNILVWHISIH